MTTRATYEMDFDTGYGELCNVPCTFLIDTDTAEAPDYHPDGASGPMLTTVSALLHVVYLDRLELTRAQMVLMIGEKAVCVLETSAADCYADNAPQAQASGHPVIEVA